MANPLAGNPYYSQYDPSSIPLSFGMQPHQREAQAKQMVAEEVKAAKQGRRPGTRARYARMQAGKAGRTAEQGLQALGSSALFPRAALLGGVLPAIGVASEEYAEGRPTGAVAALAGGGAAAMGGRALGGMLLPGRLKPVGQLLGAVTGGFFGAPAAASGAEYLKRQLTKEPTAGKEAELSSQLAAREKMGELDLRLLSNAMQAETQNILTLNKAIQEQQFLQDQRYMPMIEKAKNNELVRNQAMMATMGNQYARLGTLATAGKLATGSQAETGAMVRTAMTANPYAQNVLQAPSISFG